MQIPLVPPFQGGNQDASRNGESLVLPLQRGDGGDFLHLIPTYESICLALNRHQNLPHGIDGNICLFSSAAIRGSLE